MKDRILELAFEAKIMTTGKWFHGGDVALLEAFYQLAHQDGQRAMRERAANECEAIEEPEGQACADLVRNLEIE